MATEKHKLECMLLTLQSENVIVPNAAVAEIVPSRDVIEIEGSPRWMLGRMKWRGFQVPLVSFEAASERAGTVSTSTQIAVLYSLTGQSRMPYIGLAISGVPHVGRFSRDQIKADPVDLDNHPMVARKIRVNGAAASILDLQAIENMLKQSLPGHAEANV